MRYALQRAGGGLGLADLAGATVPGAFDVYGALTAGSVSSSEVAADGLAAETVELLAVSPPLASAAVGALRVARGAAAGAVPQIVDEFGRAVVPELHLLRHRKYIWLAQAGVNAFHSLGNSVANGTGSNEAGYVPVFGAGRFANMARHGVFGSSGAGSVQYSYVTTGMCATAKADGTSGGFVLDIGFAGRDASVLAGKRAFAGLCRAAAPPVTNVAYESHANSIGFVKKAAASNLFFSCRGASAGVEVDLGASFPFAGTHAAPNAYLASIWQHPKQRTMVHYWIVNVDTGAEASGSLTVDDTTLPDASYPLTWINAANNNTTAQSVYVTTLGVTLDACYC